ncbi:anthranilate synthase component I [Bryobacter aggregatus]|uniref:anthranilate synthase component I n=1 Tax=Bryobacter aggregatus TaxID=360054 RepID=UPI0004E26673|nr:anthranilate synthase component I [Bryobacter aggregatus]
MSQIEYLSRSGIAVSRSTSKLPYSKGLVKWLRELDKKRGVFLSSGYEYPGRYSRWDFASVAPPLEIVARGREMEFHALNERGEVILRMLEGVLKDHPHWEAFTSEPAILRGLLKPLPALFSEEERSKQPSAFSILRSLMQEFGNPEVKDLMLIGAFGYDLLFQFDPIELKLPRDGVKDLQLFLCDEIYLMDRKKEAIERVSFEFRQGELATAGMPRKAGPVTKPVKRKAGPITADHEPAEYMAKVEKCRDGMKVGDYYEVVLRQTFSAPFSGKPSELFERIQVASPSPYEFLIQFGEEQLIGASPEMFVRVDGDRVETCPISGTAKRTGDPLKDAENIKQLLNSAKEESELTMCTDVDRNDKSRVCLPGTVEVIGRRLIESYAGVFHTVDHVVGTLDPKFDSLDAFLTHMWAVTVIGAPKKAAAQAVEDLEKTARGWYGGAIGMISLSGDINTGILIRTVHLKDGYAKYPAGATLLYDSDPASEENETRLKATSFFRALQPVAKIEKVANAEDKLEVPVKLMLIDNDDCFIHTLANYARQAGAEVVTYRSGFDLSLIEQVNPTLVLMSPGPGRPGDFGVPQTVQYCAQRGIPVFGVCLGLQGIVEAFGGVLDVLDYPMHGKQSDVSHQNQGVFEGLPNPLKVGRYHSLYARRSVLPASLEITAETADGIIMGVRHKELPIEAVQFHPESMLTLEDEGGLRLIRNAIRILAQRPVRA